MKKVIRILLISLSLLTTGCVKHDAIIVHNLEDISTSLSLFGMSRVGVTVAIENTLSKNITISNSRFDLTDMLGEKLAEVVIYDDIYLPKRSKTSVPILIGVKFTNPLQGIAVIKSIANNSDNILVSGTMTVKFGGLKKKVKIKPVTLTEFVMFFKNNITTIDDIKDMMEGVQYM